MANRTLAQVVVGFLALERNTATLLVALVLAGTGEKLWLGFAPKYLETLGAGALIIGLFDGLQTVVGALYAYPGGVMTDRWGERKSLIVFSLVSLAGYAIVLIWNHWAALLVGAVFFLAWSALSLPATFSLVANSLKSSQHTMGIGVQSLVRRIPMILGPLVGGWFIARLGWERGMRQALWLCILLTVLTLVVQCLITVTARGAGAPIRQPDLRLREVVRTFSPELRQLLVSDILIRFCERLPYAFVVLWVIDHAQLSAQQFGFLVAIEMGTAMVCYIPVAHLADKYGRGPFVLITFVFFTLFPITLLSANGFGGLAFAFVVRGLKEFGEPARKALIINLACPELKGRVYGAYYLIRDCVVTAGSLVGAGLWMIAPQANFLGAAFCGFLGICWYYWFVFREALVQRRGRV